MHRYRGRSGININLLYENLKMSMSIDIIKKIENSNQIIDLIELIKENLYDLYNKKDVDKFLKLLFKISIIIYIQKSEIEKKRLLEEKVIIEEELTKIKDKKNYVNDVINTKMELSKKVREIDLILNDKDLLVNNMKNEIIVYQIIIKSLVLAI